MKIAMFPSDRSGCGYYRLIQSAHILEEMGHEVGLFWDVTPATLPVKADIYHFQRITTNEGLEALKYLKDLGKTVLMDMDDDLFKLYPDHPSRWYFRKGKTCSSCKNARLSLNDIKCDVCGSTKLYEEDRTGNCSEALRLVDVLTVSTQPLKETVGRYAKSCVVLPNAIDFDLWDGLAPNTDNYTYVGWAGSFTHFMDLTQLCGYIDCVRDYEETYAVFVGEDDQRVSERFSSLGDRLVLLAPVELALYPGLVKNFHIGLAPLVDNHFNQQKSALKILEYGAAGIPAIGSDVLPYTGYIEHGVNGFLVQKPKQWAKYIRALLDDPELRARMGRANYEKCRTERNARDMAVKRLQFYESVREQPDKPYNPFSIGGR